MTRWGKVSTALVAALAVSAASAEAQSANIQALANVFTAISISGSRNLDFGNVFPAVNKTIAPSGATSGHFSATGEAGADVNMTFTLPANLVFGGNNLPIGTWAACWDDDNDPSAGCTAFSPVSGSPDAGSFSAGGNLHVFIGATVSPAANQPAGAYTATVTLQLDYF